MVHTRHPRAYFHASSPFGRRSLLSGVCGDMQFLCLSFFSSVLYPCSNGGGWGVPPPYLILPTPLPLVKIRPRGVEFQSPHLSFSEVGMLLDSHFLLMQFLKYLQCD